MKKDKGVSSTEFFDKFVTNPKDRKELNDQLESQELINRLIVMRGNLGLNQKEMAKRLNKTQSYISKLEKKNDMDLTLGEIVKYASVAGLKVKVMYV